MDFFQGIDKLEKDFYNFSDKLNFINTNLEKHKNLNTNYLKKIEKTFNIVSKDFVKEDKKINIGVIGQVKTGRSTFLNTLLFNGENVLPKSVIPKTAIVTKIISSKKNFVEIEFYSKKDLKEILKEANENKNNQVSKEILNYVKENSLDIENYTNKKLELINIENFFDLEKMLNDYIGEDGKYTPLVKNITLNIKKSGIKHLCIIDTPGINDPIISRSEKTMKFLAQCDVVFLLSRSSQFLDQKDVELLNNLILRQGIKKLVLVCSRYDDGLNDTLLDYDDFMKADIETKKRLTKHSKEIFEQIIFYNKNKIDRNLIYMLKKISIPIFISSMAHNMSNKNIETYSKNELNIYKNLSYHSNISKEILNQLGNFDEIKKMLENISRQKENTLLIRGINFIPENKNNFIEELKNIKLIFLKRINLLNFTSIENLEQEKNNMLHQTELIGDNLEKVFSELTLFLDEEKENIINFAEENKNKAVNIKEDIFTEIINDENIISKSKWYNPFSWKNKETINIEIETKTSSLKVQNALKNIRSYADDYENNMTETIDKVFKKDIFKDKLLNIIMDNHDRFSESYSPLYFKNIVKQTLGDIIIPSINIETSKFIDLISEKFIGDLKNTSDKESLKILLAVSINSIYENTNEQFNSEIENFKNNLLTLKENFYTDLFNNINEEYNSLIENYNNKENQINNLKKIIKEIENYILELNRDFS